MDNTVFYKKGYKYQLVENYKVHIDIDLPVSSLAESEFLRLEYVSEGIGLLTTKSGYAWNGVSGPTRTDSTNIRASLIHDALYQLIREGLLGINYRKQADIIFRKCCKEDGMCSFRRNYYYAFVRAFGSVCFDEKKVLTAP